MKKFLIFSSSLIGMAVASHAASFYPISAVSSSTSANDLWPASNLIQGPGVGYDAAEPHNKISAGSEGNWVTADPGGFPSDYIAAAGTPILSFDLGSDVLLNEISVWGYSSGNTNGVAEFSLKFSTEDEGAGNGSILGGPYMTLGDLATGANDDTLRQSFSFTPVTARYVEVTALDNFFVAPGDGSTGGLPGGDRVGWGEVAFAIPIPEPSVSLLGLFGLAGLALRRRR